MESPKRRQFVKSTIGVSVAAAVALYSRETKALTSLFPINYRLLVPELFNTPPRLSYHYPVLIIGSGFGGAVSALRLGQAGIKAAIIERGNRWPLSKHRKIFAYDMIADGRMFWHRETTTFPALTYQLPFFNAIQTKSIDKFCGVLDIIDRQGENYRGGSDILLGTAVGGGSVIYTGVKAVPKQAYFERLFPADITFNEMVNIYYPRVKSVLNYSQMPNDIYNSLSFKHCRDWDREAAKTGYHSYKIDGNWDWNVVREEMTGHSLPSSTLGLTNFGNSNGCKQSLDQNYIPMAEATGNVTVHHNHEVKEISRNGDLYELDIVEYDPYGEIIHQKTVTCDKLIMAAGAYHTPRMLVRAKAKGTLPELNEFVGKNWGDNGNRMAFRQSLFGLPQGGPQASPSPSAIYVKDYGESPIVAENWANAAIADVGVSMSLAVTADFNNRGYFYYDGAKDDAVLHYPKALEADATNSMRKVNTNMARRNWQRLGAPGFDDVIFTGAHPVGGMEIGKATDMYGRVKGLPNMYVMDGALIPGNTGGANPSLTIAALAERNIEKVIQEDF
ncbi:GMC oxidoreductase [Enterovibrio norvegicus]|uniref:GMC oxidoreductase n=1 Tax=Enterovibrio norvegicus TaxID=188144 RepID=UPI00352F7582